VDYFFEETQPLKFMVLDIDKKGGRLDQQEFIGEHICNLAEIICSVKIYTRNLMHPHHKNQSRGTITILTEEIAEINQNAKFKFKGTHLDKKDLFGKSDPFLLFNKTDVKEMGKLIPSYKSEVIKNTLEPNWPPFIIPVQKLCNGDYDRPIIIQCFDWNKSGTHELIGQFQTNLRELITGSKKEFHLMDPMKAAKNKNYKGSGNIILEECTITKEASFLDYIWGGCEISLITAIDFTGSNGNPNDPSSLHYINPEVPNEYKQAIMAVGDILAYYDSDKMFPVYGFGAKLSNGTVTHCFPLNGNPQNPEVPGIRGILDVYEFALKNVQLYGPTIFSQVLQTATMISSTLESQQRQKYFILLIITDGNIDDMEQSIRHIVKASILPLSIVIVGVGYADFTNMVALDSDDKILTDSDGLKAARDIVQFVPFSKYKGQHYSALAKEVLAEIPTQLLGYMRSKGFVPNSRVIGM